MADVDLDRLARDFRALAERCRSLADEADVDLAALRNGKRRARPPV